MLSAHFPQDIYLSTSRFYAPQWRCGGGKLKELNAAQGCEFISAACRVLMDTVQAKKAQRESVPIVFKASPLLVMSPLRAHEAVLRSGSGLC